MFKISPSKFIFPARFLNEKMDLIKRLLPCLLIAAIRGEEFYLIVVRL